MYADSDISDDVSDDTRSGIQTEVWILIAVISTGALLILAALICIFKLATIMLFIVVLNLYLLYSENINTASLKV